MGGGGSTRRVTVQEEDGPGMVKISESVVKRLIGQDEIPDSGPNPFQPGKKYNQLQRGDEDIDRLEKYYEGKIQTLENRNKQLFEEQKEQFAQAVQEVEKKFLKTTASPVCQDLQDAVLACYQANPQQTLICSPQVRAFNDCVQRQRERILAKKG